MVDVVTNTHQKFVAMNRKRVISNVFHTGVVLACQVVVAWATLFPIATGAEETSEGGTVVHTPYNEQRVVYDFYFDDPEKINSALYWIRSLMNPLLESPYDMSPEFLDIKVIIHGTEIVTVARKNYGKYRDAVERMRYYAQLGVDFRVCGLAAADYGYTLEDFYEFIKVTPSAITELAHWQQEGYALIKPEILTKKFTIEDIR